MAVTAPGPAVEARPPAAGRTEGTEPLTLPGFSGEVVSALRPEPLEAELLRVIDPEAGEETLHWGRNYLYRARLATAAGPLEVVVKQFRNQGLKARLRRRLGGSKAARSFRVARAMTAAGVPTPEPVALVESHRPDGPSFFLCRYLPGAVEARYLLRAVAAGEERQRFPEIDPELFWRTLGRTVKRLHDAGFWHRDISVGNILIRPCGEELKLSLVDLNRTRRLSRLSTLKRCRDLCRVPVVRAEHRRIFLESYWGGPPGRWRRTVYRALSRAFLMKGPLKRPLKGLRRFLRGLAPRSTHVHIPPPPEAASARDKAVWDHLSDQPHQHAGRLEKLGVRLADARGHLEAFAVTLGAGPRVWRRYRELSRSLYARPVPWDGAGVCLRPYPADPEALLDAVDELGTRHLLLRLHPWEEDHTAEEELARELAARGAELAFAIPQNRDLVKDPGRWRAAIEEIAERFCPYGRAFQVGHAPNRSKWGVWSHQEYVELATAAAEILRRGREVEILGPAVIDFEFHAAAAILNLKRPGLYFDAVASLLYVDRRGAPENEQTGFDTVDKAVLLRAIAETARNSGERCWITEVNWPLWEGPHAPAGKGVAVDEETHADYLVRYYLLTLATGLVERVFWWQLAARGYGLLDPAGGELRRRPAFQALATMLRVLDGSRFTGPLAAPEGVYLYRFEGGEGGREVVVGWTKGERGTGRLPRASAGVLDRDGRDLAASGDEEVEVFPSPRYFLLEG